VEKYTAAFADWQVFIRPPDYLAVDHDEADSWFRLESIDGILARDTLKKVNLLQIDKPKVINDTQRELIPGASTVVTDSEQIGKLAAEYFLKRGFKHYAYCGFGRLPWSQKRLQSYTATLLENDISTVYEYHADPEVKTSGVTERWKISEWLKQLPCPLCVFACNDDRAISILEACKIADLSVPEQVAVLGVDNDELICNLSTPSLSSIELDFEQSGFSAAQHLNELIEQKASHKIIHVSPLEVIEKHSTDILAIDDKDVVAALIYIRNHFSEPIQVLDVINATCLSRRELEKRFKRILKSTIKEEIDRLRIDLIRKKLLNSTQSISQIASGLQFSDPEHFSRYFKNLTGQSPQEFRRRE
jgi:LacI family transcriptional regulator